MVRHFVVGILEARVLKKELVVLVTGWPDASDLDIGHVRYAWLRRVALTWPDTSGIDTEQVRYLTLRCFDLNLTLVLAGDRTRAEHCSTSGVVVRERAACTELCDLTQGASGWPRAALGALWTRPDVVPLCVWSFPSCASDRHWLSKLS
jgi:hypothetical protein